MTPKEHFDIPEVLRGVELRPIPKWPLKMFDGCLRCMSPRPHKGRCSLIGRFRTKWRNRGNGG